MPRGIYPRTEEERTKNKEAQLKAQNRPEVKAKQRVAHLGKHHSIETRAKMSVAQLGSKNHMYGKCQTEESKMNTSLALKGRKQTTEHIAKRSMSLKSYMFKKLQEPEYREMLSNRMRLINLGRHLPGETREKMRQKHVLMWQDIEYVKRMALAFNRKPNRAELKLQTFLDRYYPGKWRYVGDGQIVIGGMNPDFINIDGRKEIIELYGAYWHPVFDIGKRKEKYRQYGFKVAIIWDDELKDETRLRKVLRAKFK